jgi:hypothetical protein
VVNLKSTKIKRQWSAPNSSNNIAEIRVGKRGTEYFCLWLPPMIPSGSPMLRPVIELRVSVLKDAAVWIATLAEERKMPEDWLESLLDFIYLELNRRLNKAE